MRPNRRRSRSCGASQIRSRSSSSGLTPRPDARRLSRPSSSVLSVTCTECGRSTSKSNSPRSADARGAALFTGAALTGAALTGAALTGAALTGAALTGAVPPATKPGPAGIEAFR
ncbi:pentapeptide repeat-containing protein [Cryobacterium sp. SO1]|uniref:pentapeptide repeat-containing protein n=1 Tax=Cryobacterium sp. SO1 TaxID=1897061 RepID=UPI00351F41A3